MKDATWYVPEPTKRELDEMEANAPDVPIPAILAVEADVRERAARLAAVVGRIEAHGNSGDGGDVVRPSSDLLLVVGCELTLESLVSYVEHTPRS